MRIVELRLPGGPDLRMHPAINVVSGVGDDLSRRIIDAVAAIARGEVPDGLSGIIDVHGVLVDVTSESLHALGLGDHDIDPVIRPGDLPDPPPGSAPEGGDASDMAAEADRLAEQADLLAKRVEAARAALEAARDRRRRLQPRGGDSAPSLDEARARLGAARERRENAERAVRDLEAGAAAAATRIRELEQEAAGLRHSLEQPDTATDEVEAALAALEARLALRPSEYPEAEALADAIGHLLGALDAAGRRRQQRDQAEARVAEAQAAVAEARSRMNPFTPQPDAEAALEAAHAEVEEAERKVDRALVAAPLARRQLRKAQEAEAAILERLGVPSYSAYLLQSSTMHVDADSQRRLAEATAELRDAEAAVERMAAAGEPDDGELAALLRRELEQASALAGRPLGHDPEAVISVLRRLEAPAPDTTSEVEALREAMKVAGAPVPSDGSAESLAEAARSWVAGAGQSGGRREGLRSSLAEVEARLTAARALEDRRSAEDELAVARLEEEQARAAVEAARDAAEHQGAITEAARAEDDAGREAEQLAAELEAAREQARTARLATPDLGEGSPGSPASSDDQLGVYVLARLADVRAVGCTGPAPVVLDRPVSGSADERAQVLLRTLEGLAGARQVVVVDSDDRCLAWVERLGPRAAAALHP